MTKIIEPEQYPGTKYITENLHRYVTRFLNGEVIAFRGAYCSEEDQQEIMNLLGDTLGWWPNSESHDDPMYYETHHQNMNSTNVVDKSSIMLGWHLEHVGHIDEFYVGACWCMNLFKCDPDAGRTLFVDVMSVFQGLSIDDQEFLNSALVELWPVGVEHDSELKIERYPFSQAHWILGDMVARPVLNYSHETKLVLLEGKEPSEQEVARFNQLFNYIVKEVTENEDIRLEHRWEEGDMLLLDVFRLAHSVTGGFKQHERKLDGIFGILRPTR